MTIRASVRTPPALYRASPDEAWALFARAPVAHVACAGDQPILRPLHPVVVDGSICFHGGPVGEKNGMIDRDVVVSVEEHVATLPSYFFDAQRACPATTYYRSAMAWGRAELVHEGRARILGALMQRHQPEGGYVPMADDHPLYESALRKLAVIRVRIDRIEGRIKLGQNKPAERMEGALVGLWQRGAPGDLEAIEAIRDAHPQPLRLFDHDDVRFVVAPKDIAGAVGLVRDEYWNVGIASELLADSHRQSDAWILGRDARGACCTARAIADAKNAWIYDVAVRHDRRGEGLGEAMMQILLDHPRLRRANRVFLGTRDAQTFYAKLGFSEHVGPHTTMVRHRVSVAKKSSAS